MIVEGRYWQCEVCGYTWPFTEGYKPDRCRSKSCRSRKWDTGGKDEGDGEVSGSGIGNVEAVRAGDVGPYGGAPVSGAVESGLDEAGIESGTGHGIKFESGRAESVQSDEPVKLCVGCENPLQPKKGKWVCMDVGCSMYGVEQR
jgi:hypothetical protein